MSAHLKPWTVLDALACPLAVVNASGEIVFANTALEDELQQSRRLLQGLALTNYLSHANTLEKALADLAVGQLAALRYDAQLQKPHSAAAETVPVPVHVLLSAYVSTGAQDEAGALIVQMLPLQQQERLEREDRVAQQVQHDHALMRNLAHEIKNPLGGIRGAAQLLQLELPNAELAQYTKIIVQEADRLHNLVNRFLRPQQRLQLGQVNIHQLCERVRSLVLAEFPKGLRVVRDYDVSIPEFLGDAEQLLQAVLNVAHNAAQAMHAQIDDGTACLTLRTRVLRQCTFAGQRHRLALSLHVIDNGPGVPEQLRDTLFLPLVSGREGGTGLGLSLAQDHVQQHRGVMNVESRPGHTDFQILLPLDTPSST